MYDVIVGQAVKAGSLSLTSTIKSYIECLINRPTMFIILPIVIILSLCVLMGLHVLHLNLTKQALLARILAWFVRGWVTFRATQYTCASLLRLDHQADLLHRVEAVVATTEPGRAGDYGRPEERTCGVPPAATEHRRTVKRRAEVPVLGADFQNFWHINVMLEMSFIVVFTVLSSVQSISKAVRTTRPLIALIALHMIFIRSS